MGKYTAWDEPIVDRTVEDHLRQIIAAIRSRLSPQSVILRGSFARGEGSVAFDGDHLRFLSDYELVVVTPHTSDREALRTVGRRMTAQLGVETSISRLHSRNLRDGHSGGRTIAMYEMQNGGLVLYGEPVLARVSAIDPSSLDLWSALRLLFNRMAESLSYEAATTDLEGLRWATKTALGCAEALLLACGRYHSSYAERGRRFEQLAPQLDEVTERANGITELVRRASAFKLRPSLDCYPGPAKAVWEDVKRACDATLRYVIQKYLGFSFGRYAEFPDLYSYHLLGQKKIRLRPVPLLRAGPSQNAYLILRHLHDRRRLLLRLIASAAYPAHQIVYSVVPLAFLGNGSEEQAEVRRQLGRVMRLDRLRSDNQAEQEYLRSCTNQAWKDLCYGLWERI